jgi:cell division protein ZapA (FtsZ GTPase activity inhibitor)
MERLRVELLGSSFFLQTDEDPVYVTELIDYFHTKIQDIQGNVQTSDPVKVAILSGLLAVDELFRARKSLESYESADAEAAERIAGQLIEKLDRSLDSDTGDSKTEGSPPTETT